VIGLQQHQGLPIDLLQLEVLDVVGTSGQTLDEVADLRDGPLQWIVGGHVDVEGRAFA